MNNASKKNTFYIIASIVLSLIVHFCFLAIFMQITLSSAFLKPPKKKPTKYFNLLKTPPPKHNPGQGMKKTSPSPGIKKVELPPNMPDKVDMLDNTIPEDGKKLTDKYELPSVDDVPKPPRNPNLPKIISIDGDSLSNERKQFKRNLIPKLPGMPATTIFSISAGGKKGRPSNSALPLNMRVPLPPSRQHNNSELPATPATTFLPGENVEGMDLMIDVKLYKFPVEGGGGFFKIDLSPNKRAAALRTFRKDVIFLLDVSGSIGRIRLEELKSGLFRTLETLHPEDRFNIVAFRSGNIPLFPEPVHPTKKNIKLADAFLFKMRHSGSTNIYSALKLYAGRQHRAGLRPLTLFLLSDGKVNYGNIIDNRDLINEISNSNQQGAAIYTFSCGTSKNSFLMDLLSYRNRGDSDNIEQVDNSNILLSRFIYNANDIKVTDIEYQVSSNLAENTFPKRLPNLHKGKILSIYGLYTPETKDIGLRLTGLDSTGIRRELVFGGKLKDAAIAGNNLPAKWAIQYIYHLYSQITVKYDDKLKKEILDTARQFNLQLPYLNAHLKPGKKNYLK